MARTTTFRLTLDEVTALYAAVLLAHDEAADLSEEPTESEEDRADWLARSITLARLRARLDAAARRLTR